ncbi:host-nuclease inhibitor Gam family protein [Leptospira sp. FAT2]|uniref:host-nuclease inhibitor Gam family protein n=1 Tax=Leptospira sanjuanensis TaxID=2879643 RepID=UPI001EE97920|nr:host-nuclease inhibitor Gam family protein [Leptospira sanjuanensis]MCG6191784.1 host-nuclease inhibitor Gam family protein [Leptospira sanjuanensis]
MPKAKNSLNKTILVDLPDNRYRNLAEIAQAIQQLGETKRERERIKSRTDDEIAKLQLDLQDQMFPFDLKIQHIASGIKFFVDHHKTELFPDPEYRTCKFATGSLKLRRVPPSVKTRGTAKLFERILSENGLLEKFSNLIAKLSNVYLRVKLELNKEQILAEPLRAMQKIGIEFNEEAERLYIAPNETELEIEADEESVA